MVELPPVALLVLGKLIHSKKDIAIVHILCGMKNQSQQFRKATHSLPLMMMKDSKPSEHSQFFFKLIIVTYSEAYLYINH